MLWRVLRSAIAAFFCLSVAAFAQSPARLQLGIPQPVAGTSFTAFVVATNPDYAPAVTGTVTFDFGDGTAPVAVSLDNHVAKTTHTYASTGKMLITASYSGDSNFASTSTTVSGLVVDSVSPVTLNVFGDSISAAENNVNAIGVSWVTVVAYTQQWKLNNVATASNKAGDQCPHMYATPISPSSYSAVLLGQNDIVTGNVAVQDQFRATMLACMAWILLPDTAVNGDHPKYSAQNAAVTLNGSWSPSDLNPTMGVHTTNAGDSLSGSLSGDSLYVGFSATVGADYTVDVLVDGQKLGEYSPTTPRPGNFTTVVPYGARLHLPGSGPADKHTLSVVCVNPGTTGCYVDWMGGNGFAAPNQTPTLWLATPYLSNQPTSTYTGTLAYVNDLRAMIADYQSDRLGVTLADVFANFNGETDFQCLSDQVHPSACGHQILAATFLNAMNWLVTKSQRVSFGAAPTVAFGDAPASLDAVSTSGLPPVLTLVSGPATIEDGLLSSTGPGSVTIEADQPGNADYTPALPAQETIQIAPAPVEVSLSASASEVPYQGAVSLSATVSSRAPGPIPGTVTFLSNGTSLGTASLDGSGVASLENLTLNSGSYTFSATYSAQGNFGAGQSSPLAISVDPKPDFAFNVQNGNVTIIAGQSASVMLSITPDAGFQPTVTFSCSGLPALASCQFSGNPLKAGPAGATEKVTILTQGRSSGAAATQGQLDGHGGTLALAASLCSPGLLLFAFGNRGRRTLFYGLALMSLALAPGLIGCGTSQPSPPSTPAGTSTVTITAVAVEGAFTMSHSYPVTLTVQRQ